MTTQDKQNLFLRLVSSGLSVPEARTRADYWEGVAIPAEEPKTLPTDGKKELRAKLAELGINAAPNASLQTLRAKLAEAENSANIL